MGVWEMKPYIVVPLVALIMGHWSLLMHGIFLKSEWTDGHGCAITSTSIHFVLISYVYTMGLDLLVLLLATLKLVRPGLCYRGALTKLVFGDGLIYFIIAYVLNFANLTTVLNTVRRFIGNLVATVRA